jgi:hypothetical protein
MAKAMAHKLLLNRQKDTSILWRYETPRGIGRGKKHDL